MYKIFVLLLIFPTLAICFQNCGNDFKTSSAAQLSQSNSTQCSSSVACSTACQIDNGTGEIYNGQCLPASCSPSYMISGSYCVPTPPSSPFTPKIGTFRQKSAANQLTIGAAVDTTLLTSNPTYASIAADQFDTLVVKNDLKWDRVHPSMNAYDFKKADQVVEFAIRQSQKIHGHTLVWHNQNPTWLTSGAWTPAQKRSFLETHIKTVIGYYKTKYPGTILAWDVVNEAILSSDAEVQASTNGGLRPTIWSDIDTQPDGYIRLAFQWAHEADPNAILYYNDYNNDSVLNAKSNAVYNLVAKLKSQGVPIHGIGIQEHMSTDFGTPSVAILRQNISRYKALGLKVRFTEFDVRTNTTDGTSAIEKTRQQELYTNVFSACLLEKPTCTGVTLWGFTSKDSWIPSFFAGYSPLLPFDDNLKPTEFFNIITQKWP